MKGLIGRKIGMTQTFDDQGRVVPITVVQAGPSPVVQLKRASTDGYNALQLGFGEKKRPNKPLLGHCAKAGVKPPARLVELRSEDSPEGKEGDILTVEIFSVGDRVDVTGWSKGKGFTGVVKRHGFSGGPKTHGSMSHDVPGSIGASTSPGRVLKGTKLPGRMGGKRTVAKNREIIGVDVERNLLLIKGSLPGAPKGYLIIKAREG